MILVFDVGNTELTIGLFSEAGAARPLAHHDGRRAHARRIRRAASLVAGGERVHAGRRGRRGDRIGRAARHRPLARGVPATTSRWARRSIVDARRRLPITLDVDEPLTVGADRLINTLAASRLYRARRDRRRPGHGDDVRLHHVRRRFSRRSDRARRDDVVGDADATDVQASGDGADDPDARDRDAHGGVHSRGRDVRRRGRDRRDGARGSSGSGRDRSTPIVIATGGFATTMAALCKSFDRVEPHLTLQGLRWRTAFCAQTGKRARKPFVTNELLSVSALLCAGA